MSLKARIDQDLKTAMLAKDKEKTDVIRGIKSAVLYAEVASGNREAGLADTAIEDVLVKEAKKRQESADMYEKGGAPDKAEKERYEKTIIESYLPKKLDGEELDEAIAKAIAEAGVEGPQAMGKVIGSIKATYGARVDGAVLAVKVKEALTR